MDVRRGSSSDDEYYVVVLHKRLNRLRPLQIHGVSAGVLAYIDGVNEATWTDVDH